MIPTSEAASARYPLLAYQFSFGSVFPLRPPLNDDASKKIILSAFLAIRAIGLLFPRAATDTFLTVMDEP